MAKKLGYTRAMGAGGDLTARSATLARAGCSRIFEDNSPASVHTTPLWRECIESLAPGDFLVVSGFRDLGFTLDQLAESLSDVVGRDVILEICEPRFLSKIDTPTLLDIVKELDAFERAGRRDLINVGLSSARAEGRIGGRRHKLTPLQLAELKTLMGRPGANAVEVGQRFGISRAAVYNYLKR